MPTFQAMGLPEALLHKLQAMGFHDPTPIQEQAIPPALEGRDILGSAQTGTGKTGAFGIPLIAQLMQHPEGAALVMTPTRELARQVLTQLNAMVGRSTKISTALLIGGESMTKQLNQIARRPRIFVGTPGRINDHLRRNGALLKQVRFLVLDETDRMLDMGFTEQIESVLQHMPRQRQTLLFSATLPKHIVKMSERYLEDPVRVAVAGASKPVAQIEQDVVHLKESDKYDQLLEQLNERQGSVIVFVKTKYGAGKMATRLTKAGHDAAAIHGALRQNKRDRVLAAFRREQYRVLVATDVAARGLDIPHIEHVINYDLPQNPEDYVHRIGRTARAGAHGFAISMVTPSDKRMWQMIQRLMYPEAHASKADRPPSRRKPRQQRNDRRDARTHASKPSKQRRRPRPSKPSS